LDDPTGRSVNDGKGHYVVAGNPAADPLMVELTHLTHGMRTAAMQLNLAFSSV